MKSVRNSWMQKKTGRPHKTVKFINTENLFRRDKQEEISKPTEKIVTEAF